VSQSRRLEGRIALITGASRGIGAAVARRFAAEGAHLILAARTRGGLEEIDDTARQFGDSATLVELDLMDGPAIDQLGGAIAERFGRLDILVGNAAMLGALSPMGHYSPATWDNVIALNLTANWRLIRSMDALLRASDAGRAIFTTCAISAHPRAYWGPYGVSKAGLEAMVQIYAEELKRTNVRVNCLDPGIVETRLRADAYPGEAPGTQAMPDDVAGLFVTLATPDCSFHGARLTADEDRKSVV